MSGIRSKYLWPTLNAVDEAGRVYYNSSCPEDTNYQIPFPPVDVQSPPKSARGFAAVQAIFVRSEKTVVTAGGPGIIRVRIGSVSESILRTNISAIRMAPLARYNAGLAINAIESTPEIQSAERHLGIRLPSLPFDMLVAQPRQGLPHLPELLTNLTMDQALDDVAKTFQGIVEYGYCSPPSTYDITFTGGIYFDERVLNDR
ncbi:MAG: hypothetical protein ACREHF_14725 [Rhizomicrobium sp.]